MLTGAMAPLGRHGVDLVSQLPDLLGQEGGGVVLGLRVDEEAAPVQKAPLGAAGPGPAAPLQDGVDAAAQLDAGFHGRRLILVGARTPMRSTVRRGRRQEGDGVRTPPR